MHSFYRWFYKHYWWLLMVLFALNFVQFKVAGALQQPEAVMVLFGLNTAAFFFAQKQRLADRRFRIDLLMHFSGQLARTYPKIRAIHNEGEAGEVTSEQYETLLAFLDICGQIHLHYTLHEIPEAFWRTWFNRIRVYYYNPKIRKIWDIEFKRDVLYDFDWDALK